MPRYLFTYDLRENAHPHAVFIEKALSQGLTYVFAANDELARLPNTTLWGVFATRDDAKSAFAHALVATEVEIGPQNILEKRFICQFVDWSLKSDTRKPPDPRWSNATKIETCIAHRRHDPFFAY